MQWPQALVRSAVVCWASGLVLVGPALARDVPFLAGRINDTAHIVPDDVAARLEEKLRKVEESTGAQVAVLTIDSLDGEPLEDYSMRVAETWKLGQKGKDNGVLFLVAKSDRKMRIEVGYGLEGALPDAITKRILDNVTRPRFRAGDFGGGVEATVDSIAGIISGDASAVPPEATSGSEPRFEGPLAARLAGFAVFLLVVGVFSFLAVFSKGCASWFLYAFLIPFWGAFPVAFLGPAGVVFLALWIVGFPILKLVLGSTPAGKHFLRSHPGLTAIATSSGHSGSGGGWSSGGFSGGGGSFGGGGSSSSW